MPCRPHDTHVTEQFGPRAASYLSSTVHAQGEDLAHLGRMLGQASDATALDLGCGGGHVAFALAPLVKQVIAYDLSQAMVDVVGREAQNRGLDNLRTRQGSVESLPYADASFDIVVSRYSTHHWHDTPTALREARRVLKPGGMAIFIDVVAPESALLDTWLQSLELLRDPSHARNFSETQWCALLRAAGFQPTVSARFRVPMEFNSWIQRMNTPPSHVAAIRSLQSSAPLEVSRHFDIRPDGTFTVDSLLLAAQA